MNAIILAAGMGTRLQPLTNDIPKCLVPVKGIPMIEQQIRFLKEVGVHDITLVGGYMADKLDYLKERYGVDVVMNEQYSLYNNIYSMYKVLDKLGDTYVLEGDVYFHVNRLREQLNQSTYFSPWREAYQNEWGLKVDEELNLQQVVIGNGKGYLMSGVSYWTEKDAAIIAERLTRKVKEGDFKDLYWDHILLEVMDALAIKIIPYNDMYEIDTLDELISVESLISETWKD